ncbi:PspC domain-containing protein [bacterium]|nr:PspC domain-containing protein [bacterium]
MESADISSQEMLDQLMRDGKISDDEYLRLSKAMQRKPEPAPQPPEQTPGQRIQRPPLHKSRNRLIGGVCAGLAEHFGCDPIIVRVIAIILLLTIPPVALISYLVLYFMLPWGGEAVVEVDAPKKPWRFAFWSAMFLTIVPMLIIKLLMIRILDLYSQIGAELPFFTIVVVAISDAYLHWAAYASVVVVILATAIYLVCGPTLRKPYATVFLLISFMWSLMFAVGYYTAVLGLPKIVVR